VTTVLKQLPKRAPVLTSQPDPITILTYAGQHWNLRVMNDEQIKWLKARLTEQKDLANPKHLTAIQAELDRRKPGPEKIRVMVALRKNSATLLERFGEVLAADNLLLSDLITGKDSTASTRFGEGLDLALSGRWEVPQGPGWPFKVDSYPNEFGSLKYEVKCKATPYHNYNNCSCEDFLYKAAGKFNGWCKHVCCVWFVAEAQML
jgi:hypothetical protein